MISHDPDTFAPRKRRARLAAPLLGVMLAAAAGGCGSGGDDNSTAAQEGSGSGGDASAGDGRLAFYQCLRDNGLDVEDPDFSGGPSGDGHVSAMGLEGVDMDDPRQAAVVDECVEEHPPMTEGEMGDNIADTEALIDFARCMRDHGFDMADPDPDGRLNLPEDFDPNSADFQAAREECQQHLAGGGVMIGGGPGSQGSAGQRG